MMLASKPRYHVDRLSYVFRLAVCSCAPDPTGYTLEACIEANQGSHIAGGSTESISCPVLCIRP